MQRHKRPAFTYKADYNKGSISWQAKYPNRLFSKFPDSPSLNFSVPAASRFF